MKRRARSDADFYSPLLAPPSAVVSVISNDTATHSVATILDASGRPLVIDAKRKQLGYLSFAKTE